jgi:peptidoglycan DL-endopeptidase CwlO
MSIARHSHSTSTHNRKKHFDKRLFLSIPASLVMVVLGTTSSASAADLPSDTSLSASSTKSSDSLFSQVEKSLDSMIVAQAPLVVQGEWSSEETNMVVTPAPPPPPPVEVPVVVEENASEAPPDDSEVQEVPESSGGAVTPVSGSVEAPSPAVEAAPAPVTEENAPAPAPTNADSGVVGIAQQYIGVPYVSGGASPSGFDCSGLTQYVYAQAGINLPRSSGDQRYAGTRVSASEAQAGDLVWSPGHVAIYAGNGQIIDAPKPGASVQQRAMWQQNPEFIRLG